MLEEEDLAEALLNHSCCCVSVVVSWDLGSQLCFSCFQFFSFFRQASGLDFDVVRMGHFRLLLVIVFPGLLFLLLQ